METKTYDVKTIEVTDEGYLVNPNDWSKEIAKEIATELNISLTEKHFEIINFLRDKTLKGESITIRTVGKSGIIDIKGFYELFTGAPLKLAMKIAGLSKPTSCV